MDQINLMELDIAKALVAKGAASGMGIDNDGNMFYVLRIYAFNSKLEPVELDVVIPPMATDMFVQIVKTMETKRE